MELTAYKVFLSYAQEDANLAKRIFSKLKAKRGVRPYMSAQYPAPGTALWDRLEQQIKNTDCFVVLWTPAGVKSQYVNQEIGAAKSYGKEIILVVKEKKSIVGALEGLEWIPYNRKFITNLIRRVEQLKKAKQETKERQSVLKIVFWTATLFVLFEIFVIYIIRLIGK